MNTQSYLGGSRKNIKILLYRILYKESRLFFLFKNLCLNKAKIMYLSIYFGRDRNETLF